MKEPKRKGCVWLLFEHEGKRYPCISDAVWLDDEELRTPYEDDGVRTCGHDYSAVIKEFYPTFKPVESCENPIQLVTHRFLNEDLIKKL